MNYLKEYKSELINHSSRVKAIINYLLNRGLTNIRDLFIYKCNIFYDSVESLKEILDKCNDEEIAIINNDVLYLDTLGI